MITTHLARVTPSAPVPAASRITTWLVVRVGRVRIARDLLAAVFPWILVRAEIENENWIPRRVHSLAPKASTR